jgi:hypothetical protein
MGEGGAVLTSNPKLRRAVETLLRDEEWRLWSDSEIARRANVSDKTVAAVRRELYPTSEIPKSRIGADGRTINIANIGKNGNSSPEAPTNRLTTAAAHDLLMDKAMQKLYGNGWVTERMWGYMAYIPDLRATGMIERRSDAKMNGFVHLTPKGCRIIQREEIPVAPFHDTPPKPTINLNDWVITRTGRIGQVVADSGGNSVEVRDDYSTRRHHRASLTKTEAPRPFEINAQVIVKQSRQVGRVDSYIDFKDGSRGIDVYLYAYKTLMTYKLDALELYEGDVPAPPVAEVEQQSTPVDEPDEDDPGFEGFFEAMTYFFDSQRIMEIMPALYGVLQYANGTINGDVNLLIDLRELTGWLNEYDAHLSMEVVKA